MSTENALRLTRIGLLFAVALFFALVAFGNITDYGSNFAFVRHVLRMDDTFRSPALMWRAIDTAWAYHAFYVLIIAWELATAVLCGIGVFRLWKSRQDPAAFQFAKAIGVLGLGLGALLYAVAFMGVGGEWFAMWQSDTWNGQEKAHMFLLMIGLALLHLAQPERDARAS
ncbi:MAG: DUF2165 domain-containing protein [Lysobacteraceae bacterium]